MDFIPQGRRSPAEDAFEAATVMSVTVAVAPRSRPLVHIRCLVLNGKIGDLLCQIVLVAVEEGRLRSSPWKGEAERSHSIVGRGVRGEGVTILGCRDGFHDGIVAWTSKIYGTSGRKPVPAGR